MTTMRTWFSKPVSCPSRISFLGAVHWVRYADPKAWGGWIGLAVYLSAYWPAFAWAARQGMVTLRLPAVAVVPVVWVALGFARAYVMTGFAWYYLGHTQSAYPVLIQVADLGGAHAVTFLLGAMTGLAADVWAARHSPSGGS